MDTKEDPNRSIDSAQPTSSSSTSTSSSKVPTIMHGQIENPSISSMPMPSFPMEPFNKAPAYQPTASSSSLSSSSSTAGGYGHGATMGPSGSTERRLYSAPFDATTRGYIENTDTSNVPATSYSMVVPISSSSLTAATTAATSSSSALPYSTSGFGEDPTKQLSPSSRKRQRALTRPPMITMPVSMPMPLMPTNAPTTTPGQIAQLPIMDFKMEFQSSGVQPVPCRAPSFAACSAAGLATSANTSSSVPPPPAPERITISEEQQRQIDTMRTQAVLNFLNQCNLPVPIPTQTLSRIAKNLVNIGFDKPLIIAFANNQELLDCGVRDTVNRSAVRQQAAEYFDRSGFRGPGSFVFNDDRKLVYMWIRCCGIDDPDAQIYAAKLFNLGYYGAQDLRHILQDEESGAFRAFKTGHERLFRYCVERAGGYESKPSSFQPPQPPAGYNMQVLPPHQPPLGHPAHGSSPPLPAPFNFGANEHGLDPSYLETLLPPAPMGQPFKMAPGSAASSGYLTGAGKITLPTTQQLAPTSIKPEQGSFSQSLNEPLYGSHSTTSSGFYSQAPPAFAMSTTSPTSEGGPFVDRELLPEHLQLLHQAINLPKPNPCRRGRKINWQALTNGELNDPRFEPLRNYTPSELQTAYNRHLDTPSISSRTQVKADLWTEANIALLERAVADSRCRHLSKVCWENLSGGRTGVEDYAPLAEFTASQLRSRYRSLFGDKRPQRLRQRKELKKLQQEQQEREQQEQREREQREREREHKRKRQEQQPDRSSSSSGMGLDAAVL